MIIGRSSIDRFLVFCCPFFFSFFLPPIRHSFIDEGELDNPSSARFRGRHTWKIRCLSLSLPALISIDIFFFFKNRVSLYNFHLLFHPLRPQTVGALRNRCLSVVWTGWRDWRASLSLLYSFLSGSFFFGKSRTENWTKYSIKNETQETNQTTYSLLINNIFDYFFPKPYFPLTITPWPTEKPSNQPWMHR